MKPITDTPAWQALAEHHAALISHHIHMRDDASASLSAAGITLDYSRHRINHETLTLLFKLAREAGLTEQIKALFRGDALNTTENRPALHTALRDLSSHPVLVNDTDIAKAIHQTRLKMADLTIRLHDGTLRGATGKPFQHIVNIGIGGSHTGPMMTVEALKDFATHALQFHFVSTVDPALLNDVLQKIDPETTLFIVSSKSFNTIETITNASRAAAWLTDKLGAAAVKQHFVAVTARPDLARQFGIADEHIFPLWDWVGGRYSIWSAIGLPLMLLIGPEQFNEFLQGANQMDKHFTASPPETNLPVMLGLLGIWYINFFNATIHAIIPYAYRLRHLIPYLQQAIMESNGKCVTKSGHALSYATCPVIIGQEGCEGQHTYHQLLHQGTAFIPADFILIRQPHHPADQTHQDLLLASALSQAEALRAGKTKNTAHAELLHTIPADQADELAAHLVIPGNKPSTLLILNQLTPATLGSLLALYEHMIFVQGVIWNINSFDQWGVELGKSLLPAMLETVVSAHNQKVKPS